METVDLPQTPPDAVSRHGVAEPGGDGEAHAVAVGLYPTGIHDERRRDRAFALGVEAAELVIFLNCLGMLH